MDRLVVDIVGDALAWMSYHVLSYLWSSMNYVCAKLRGLDHDQEESRIENEPLNPSKKRDCHNPEEVVVNIPRR